MQNKDKVIVHNFCFECWCFTPFCLSVHMKALGCDTSLTPEEVVFCSQRHVGHAHTHRLKLEADRWMNSIMWNQNSITQTCRKQQMLLSFYFFIVWLVGNFIMSSQLIMTSQIKSVFTNHTLTLFSSPAFINLFSPVKALNLSPGPFLRKQAQQTLNLILTEAFTVSTKWHDPQWQKVELKVALCISLPTELKILIK